MAGSVVAVCFVLFLPPLHTTPNPEKQHTLKLANWDLLAVISRGKPLSFP